MAKILIVDDDRSIIMQLRQMLQRAGHHSSFVGKIEFIWSLLASDPVDLILLDMHMPEVDGLTLLRSLKTHQAFQEIPVIILTSEINEQLLAQSLVEGAVDFINKPISETILQARMQSILEQRETLRQLQQEIQERQRAEALALQTSAVLEQRIAEATETLRSTHEELQQSYSELERLNRSFQLFVPQPFINRILFQHDFQVGQFLEERLSILFADLRAYTHLSEQMSPEENFSFLNTFYNLMEPPISQNQGFIDKFIGDAIMALFDEEASPAHAVQAAIDMQNELTAYNERRQAKGRKEIRMGIGINTGEVMIGALGSPQRLSSTVIGDHVNLASRIQELSRKYNSRILISHYTQAELDPEKYLMREINTIRVRGRSAPLIIYEVFNADPPMLQEKKIQTRIPFLQGIVFYKAQIFDEALRHFEECLNLFPEDIAALEYLKRCRYFQKHPPHDPFWDNIAKEGDVLIDHSIRRRSTRYCIQASVKIWINNVGIPLHGKLRDLSITGLGLELRYNLTVGEIVMVEILWEDTQLVLAFKHLTFKVLCRVAWEKPNNEFSQQATWASGLEFVTMSLEQEQALRQALVHWTEDSPP